MEIKQNIQETISMFDKVINTYEANLKRIEELEGLENDIRHEISLGKKRGVVDGYKLYQEQREILLERYEKKDENELLHDMYLFCKANGKLKSGLSKVVSSIANTSERLEKRVYRPRYMSADKLTMATVPVVEYKSDYELVTTKHYTKPTMSSIISKSEEDFDKIEVDEVKKSVLCYRLKKENY